MIRSFLFTLLLTLSMHANVQHKDEFIDTYLSNISANMEEKTEILEHIQTREDGTFIDIGTGGDSIAIIASQLPKNSSPTLIAADIDPLVLDSIATRRPEIQEFIHSASGPKVEFVAMSATHMEPIKDSTVSGVVASALAHEVFSYIPAKPSLDQFIEEVCRVLEKGGVFIYRDPKWVDDPSTSCRLHINNEIAKYYTIFFLSRFLDRTFSSIRDYKEECCKPNLYSCTDVTIHAHLKNIDTIGHFPFEEFLHIPSRSIDYTKNFFIEAPKGLISEIQRHYLMYVKNYFVGGFLDPSHFRKDIILSDLSTEEQEVLKAFLKRNPLMIKEGCIPQEFFPTLFKESELIQQFFSEGVRLTFRDTTELSSFLSFLPKDQKWKTHLYRVEDTMLVIDPILLSLMFRGRHEGIFQFIHDDHSLPWDLFEHLKLEGEEHYFYKTTDELITYMGQLSRFVLKDTHKKNYLLAPIDGSHIKVAPRKLYQIILERDMSITDNQGTICAPETSKNIIHFSLQPKQQAFKVYNDLLQEHASCFPNLKKWVSHVETRDS